MVSQHLNPHSLFFRTMNVFQCSPDKGNKASSPLIAGFVASEATCRERTWTYKQKSEAKHLAKHTTFSWATQKIDLRCVPLTDTQS